VLIRIGGQQWHAEELLVQRAYGARACAVGAADVQTQSPDLTHVVPARVVANHHLHLLDEQRCQHL
jgi:hypothetical protein